MNYRVQLNDTPASIARKFNGDPRHLILVNPHKPKMLIDGNQTFRNLVAGEVIALPPSWRVGLHGVGDGTVGHGGGGHGGGHGHGWGGHGGWGGGWGGGGYWNDGVWIVDDGYWPYGLAGVGLGAAADVTADAAAVLALDGTTPGLSVPRIVVKTFQTDYNAAVAAGTYTGPALTQIDGEYGPGTATALAQVQGSVAVPTGFTSFSAETAANLASWVVAITADTGLNAPSDNVLAFQDNWNYLIVHGSPPVPGAAVLTQDGEYGTATAAAAAIVATANGLPAPPAASPTYAPVTPPAPTPSNAGGGVVTLPVTVITGTAPASSSMTPILIAAVAAAGGLGAFYYLKHRKASSAPSSRSAATVRSPGRRLAY